MRNKKFEGVGVALVTPFSDDGQVDYQALERLVGHVTDGGVDYLVVHGTTSESPTLTPQEKQDTLDFIRDHNAQNLPIVLGMSGNDTALLCSSIKNADLEGVDALLCAAPYYNKPSQAGLLAHFNQVAEASRAPVILYNVPARTSSNLEARTTAELSRIDNIIAIKESSGDINQCAEVQLYCSDDFMMTSGEDMFTLPLMSMGGVGVISVIANALPQQLTTMVKCFKEGNFETSNRVFQDLVEPIRLIFQEGNPTGVKEMLKQLGICSNHVRLPLVKASEDLARSIGGSLNSLGIKKGG